MFRRTRPAQTLDPDPVQVRGMTSARPVAPIPHGGHGLTAGWAPFGHGQATSEQIGAYAGTQLTQYPVNLPGLQLHCGREGNNPSWFVPTTSVVPAGLPSTFVTQQRNSNAGAQRRGSRFTGALGPVTAGVMQSRVAAAQVRQTAVAGLPQFLGLTPTE